MKKDLSRMDWLGDPTDSRTAGENEPASATATRAQVSHTPGSWEVAPFCDTDEVLNVVANYEERAGSDGRVTKHAHWIAECDAGLDFDTDHEAQLDENIANAHLIAAAPDLLAACKEFVRKCECGEARSTRSYIQMKAAILKAEGR